MTEPNANVNTNMNANEASPAPSPSSPVSPTNVNPNSPPDNNNEDARSVAGSEKSTASSRSGIPKFGGSRLPTKSGAPLGMASAHGASNTSLASTSGVSRIGRPCAGQANKAALPNVTPPKTGE